MSTFEIFLLIEETSGVGPQLLPQARHQPSFPASLLCMIQQGLKESFRQALERRKRVRWPDFESLRQALATVNFRPEFVALQGGITTPERLAPSPAAPRRLVIRASPHATGAPPPQLAKQTHREIDDAESQVVDIPETYDGRHFCLSFHMKGVCNRNCGGQHSHRALSQSELRCFVRWCEKFCSKEAAPPVQEVDAGGRNQASTLPGRTGRTRGN